MRKGRREPWELKSAQILKANPNIPVVPKSATLQKKWHTETGVIERMQTQLQESGKIERLARKKPRRAAPAPVAAERAFDLWDEEEEDASVGKIVAPGAGLAPGAVQGKASNGWPTVYKNDPHVLGNAVETLDPERFVSGHKRKHRSTRMAPVPSKVKAVEVAAPGASYRPEPEAHALLMSRAAAIIVQEEEKVKASRERLGLKEGQVSAPLPALCCLCLGNFRAGRLAARPRRRRRPGGGEGRESGKWGGSCSDREGEGRFGTQKRSRPLGAVAIPRG
jgi:hypothetical protein